MWKRIIQMEITATQSDFKNHARVDRIGIMASVLCAIHCALTPVLLIVLPTFGKAWAHPSTHWGMALVVIPIAVFMIRKGYQKHGRKWVVMAGSLGIVLIVVGAILPYVEFSPNNSSAVLAASSEDIKQVESGVSEHAAASG